MSKFELNDKVAIVTGGAGGIGSSITRTYAEAGAKVVIAGRNQANLDKVADDIRALGAEVLAIGTDITVPDQVDHMVKETVDTFGRLDVLVNNAGGAPFVMQAEDLPPEAWVVTAALNLTGTGLCTVAAGKVMIAQNSGKIINIASATGIKGEPTMVPYGAAKAGVINMTLALARGWAQHNINVNCIAPGATATEGMKRMGWLPPTKRPDGTAVPDLLYPVNPQDVADLALFLASPASDHISGELMAVRAMNAGDR